MKKKQHNVVPQRTRTKPRIGRAITRVRLSTPPLPGVAVEDGRVEGRRDSLNIRPGLMPKEEPVGVWKWQLKRTASATVVSVRNDIETLPCGLRLTVC